MPVASKPGIEHIAWSLDGKPVNLEWDSCSMTAPGGYDRLSAQIVAKSRHRLLRQGARVKGVRPNGKVLYLGTVVSLPKVVNDVATVEAEGYAAVIRRRNARLPYVISDASQWSSMDEQPFDYANNQKYSLQSKGDGLGWIISKDNSYTTSNRAGYALYVPGHKVQRIRAVIRKTADDGNFDLEVRDADDLGSANVVSTKTLGVGTTDGDSWNVPAVNQNTVIMDINSNSGGGAVGTQMRVVLQAVSACVLADDTDWVTSDVVADVASRVSFASNADDGQVDIGPLDWSGSWDGLLDFCASLEDWIWMVEEDRTKGPKQDAMLTFRDWGRKTWTTTLDMATDQGLTVAPMYNKVTVHYERPAGVPQHKSYTPDDFSGLDDPIPDLIYEYPDAPVLENPQRSTNRADQIGEKLLRRVVKRRLVGGIKVAGLLKGHPFDIKAGDKLDVQGFDPKVPSQRISQVTYNVDGTVDCRLERSYDVAAMLNRMTLHAWNSGHRS